MISHREQIERDKRRLKKMRFVIKNIDNNFYNDDGKWEGIETATVYDIDSLPWEIEYKGTCHLVDFCCYPENIDYRYFPANGYHVAWVIER